LQTLLQPKGETKQSRQWILSNRHWQIRIAKWWGLKDPAEWDALSDWSKAEMAAFYEGEHGMERWERMNPPKQAKK